MALEYKSSLARYRRYLQLASAQPLWHASIYVILSLILLIVLIFVALRPTLIKISSLLGEIKSQQEIVAKLNRKIMNLQRAGELLDKNKSLLVNLDQAIPSDAEWESWVQSIQAYATESGVLLNTMYIGPSQVVGKDAVRAEGRPGIVIPVVLPTGVTGLDFSVELVGNYEQLRLLVKQLEANRRLPKLTSVQISREKDGTLKMRIAGLISYNKEVNQQ